MESNGNSRSALLTAGGVLSILGGVLEVIGGGIVLGVVINIFIGGTFWCFDIPWLRFGQMLGFVFPGVFIVAGILILVLGAIGIAGGISALNRKSFGLSLAGAICILPTVLLGILAIIFVSVSRREF
jgi:hypothetical protein